MNMPRRPSVRDKPPDKPPGKPDKPPGKPPSVVDYEAPIPVAIAAKRRRARLRAQHPSLTVVIRRELPQQRQRQRQGQRQKQKRGTLGLGANMNIVISSGHGKYVRGASGYIDEVDEARKVVERVAAMLRSVNVNVKTFHDDVSQTQDENLNRIVNYHNAQQRELDVSVHFNAYQTTSSPMGCECLYVTQQSLASEVAGAICTASGLKNRGPKPRNDLFFLNNTNKPAILIETCFVDSHADCDIYYDKFDTICRAIAEAIVDEEVEEVPVPPEPYPPTHEVDTYPTIAQGDKGPAVVDVQVSLGVPADGDFGAVTDEAVKGYQAAAGLKADGVVGPITWEALDELDDAKASGNDGLSQSQISPIVEIALASSIARYNWRDRGIAPEGYTAGIALCFALAATWLREGDDAVYEMAQADRNDFDEDALTYYAAEFKKLGMSNSADGIDTLRHLFVMLLGLGMRESSGRYCEGRDMSATNVESDTAEAGMFQTSWNIRSCCDEIGPLLDMYWKNPNGFLSTFRDDVSPDSNDLGNFGSGDGAKYQFLSKFAPAFHAFVTAIGMRYLRQHWGPINRSEVELRKEADTMLLEVQHFLSENSAETMV